VVVAVLDAVPAAALDAALACPVVVAVLDAVPAAALDAALVCPEDANVAVRANVPDAGRANALT
jgi:hypothetical protein